MWTWPIAAALAGIGGALLSPYVAEDAVPAGLSCIWDRVTPPRMLQLWAQVSARTMSAARYQTLTADAQAQCADQGVWRNAAQAQAAFNYALERAQLETAAAALSKAGTTRGAVIALWGQLTPELRAAAIDETPYPKGDGAFVTDVRKILTRQGGLTVDQLQPALDVLTAYGTIQRDVAVFNGTYRPPAPKPS